MSSAPGTSSNLSNAKYGYDFVVATTQVSLNGIIMEFLNSHKEPVVTVCYVAADTEAASPVQIEYDELKGRAYGSDPFSIPDGADINTNIDLQHLRDARFIMGFQATLGVPLATDPAKLPDIVTLGSYTGAVGFNMLCSQFNIVQLNLSSHSPPTWLNKSQPENAPWIFTSKVDLRLSTVDQSAYKELPKDIQKKTTNVSDTAFSVQQLLFDFTNASLMTVPTISGIDSSSPLLMLLQQYFVPAYFSQMQKEGQPLLGCSIVPQTTPISSLTPTSFNFNVNPYVDPDGHPFPQSTIAQQRLATLDYLCAADGKKLEPAVAFNWNWVDISQISDYDGTIAINRNTLANYFRHQLAPYVPTNCILPSVKVRYDAKKAKTKYDQTLTPGQTPTVTMPSTGSIVLRFDYTAKSSDRAGAGGDLGSMTIRDTYSLVVEFINDTIIITQHLVVYMDVRALKTSGDGNIVDKTIVDTYSLDIDESGNLVVALTPVVTDHSNSPRVKTALSWFTNFNNITADAVGRIKACTGTQLTGMPISTIQDYVFPGGKSFIFMKVSFSAFQDLVSFIRYADATGPVAQIAPPNTDSVQ